jgi:hypothetical protein
MQPVWAVAICRLPSMAWIHLTILCSTPCSSAALRMDSKWHYQKKTHCIILT